MTYLSPARSTLLIQRLLAPLLPVIGLTAGCSSGTGDDCSGLITDPVTIPQTVYDDIKAKRPEGALDDYYCRQLCTNGDNGAGGSNQGGSGTEGHVDVPDPYTYGYFTTVDSCALATDKVAVLCTHEPECIGGRRPAGLVSSEVSTDDALGRYFAKMAHLEAASIVAFDTMASELMKLGLVDLAHRAREARRDEIRHARIFSRLAAERGTAVPTVEVAKQTESRSIVDIAIENAVEGTVLEAFAAIVVAHQARTAKSPELRRVFAAVALDEANHAALSFDLGARLNDLLTPAEQARVEAAREEALRGLESVVSTIESDVATELGLPTAEIRRLGVSRLRGLVSQAA